MIQDPTGRRATAGTKRGVFIVVEVLKLCFLTVWDPNIGPKPKNYPKKTLTDDPTD